MVSNQFLSQEDRNEILFSKSFKEIEAFIKNYKAPKVRTY